MGAVTIRNLDDWVIDALKAQAKANQRSLEAELRYLLTQEVSNRARMSQFRERTAQMASATADVPQTDSTELIRQDRERSYPDLKEAQTAPLFQTHIIVDWSGKSSPTPKKESADAIWWAVARIAGGVEVEESQYARTRYEALDRLGGLIADELDAGRRVLVGFDFPFGYPKGVAKHLTGRACALALWNWLAREIEDGPDNDNNRYHVAAAINRAYPGVGPFWGRPAAWDYPTIPARASVRTAQEGHPPERRICDDRARGAKTVWQLAYAGSVGSQMLLGLPALKRLKADPRVANRAKVWPFETGLRTPDARAVIAEVYPSLLRDEVNARRYEGEILDSAQVRVNAEAFAWLDAGGGLAPLFAGAPCLTPEERRIVGTEEAWILGLGHEEALKGALPPARLHPES